MRSEGRLLLQSQNDNRDSPPRKVLLIPHIPVGREQQVEARFFGCSKQVSIAEHRPTLLGSSADQMAGEVLADWNWSCLIEENLHRAMLRGPGCCPGCE